MQTHYPLTELIGLRERIEKRLVGVLPSRHRVNAVMTIGAEFNQLLLTTHRVDELVSSTQNGNGADPGGGASPSAPGVPVAAGPAPLPRRFKLVRLVDHSGVSGTGDVAEGTQFSDGSVALRWHGEHPSTAVWPSIADVLVIHGHGGDTVLRWLDQDPATPDASLIEEKPAAGKWWHVTEPWPTGYATDCMATAPTGERINPADGGSALTYHVCRMETGHNGDQHLCCACDHSWPKAAIS